MLLVSGLLALGSTAATASVAAGLVGATFLTVGARHVARTYTLLGAVAFVIGAYRAQGRLTQFEAERERAQAVFHEPLRCAVEGRVLSSPTLSNGKLAFSGAISSLDCEGRRPSGEFRARLYGAPSSLARGDHFRAITQLAPVRLFQNFDLPDPRPGAARRGNSVSGSVLSLEVVSKARGLRPIVDQARAHARARIAASYPASTQPMARALVLGENDLGERDARAFAKSGLAHLLAVSGTHLVLAVLTLVRTLEALLRRIPGLAARREVARWAASLGVLLAPAYADFSGGSGSAWRAAWMLMALLGARALGRRARTGRVLALTLWTGWWSDPLIAFDLSFLLSITALMGLLAAARLTAGHAGAAAVVAPAYTRAVRRALRVVSGAALSTLLASLACTPILLLMSSGVTLAGVAGNLLAAPVGEIVALPLCLAHLLAAPIPALELGMATSASVALEVVRALAHQTAAVDWAYVQLAPPGRWHWACLGIGAAGAIAARGRSFSATGAFAPKHGWSRGGVLLAASGLTLGWVEHATRVRGASSDGATPRLRVTMLDVGQGDAALVDLPDGRLMLVDGGGLVPGRIDPGQRVILPTLRARRRKRLDLMVLSHPHPDHLLGLLSVAREIDVGEFWFGEVKPQHGALHELMETLRQRGTRLRPVAELCRSSSPTAYVRVLSPCDNVDPNQSANDNSLVLRVALGEHAALLTGDAERWAEQRLMTSGHDLSANFLKVGHHGSRTSTSPEFLARVAPELAAISCGVRNRFGHPHARTRRTLLAERVPWLSLAQSGAVQWQTDGERQRYRSFRGDRSTPAGGA